MKKNLNIVMFFLLGVSGSILTLVADEYNLNYEKQIETLKALKSRHHEENKIITLSVKGQNDPIKVILSTISKARNINLLHYDKVKFSDANGIEFIAYYENPKYRYEISQAIDEVYYIFIDSSKIAYVNLLNRIGSFDYDDRTSTEIKEFKIVKKFGWNRFGCYGDITGDGSKEFIFFGLSGMALKPSIRKVINGKMEVLFLNEHFQRYPDKKFSDIITDIEQVDKDKLLITWAFIDYKKGKVDYIKYLFVWDGKDFVLHEQ